MGVPSLKKIFCEAKGPVTLPVEEFKVLLQSKKLRGAGLYELERRQIYYVDVPRGHPYYQRPWVRTDE